MCGKDYLSCNHLIKDPCGKWPLHTYTACPQIKVFINSCLLLQIEVGIKIELIQTTVCPEVNLLHNLLLGQCFFFFLI